MATDYITVTTAPTLNVTVDTQATNVTVEQPSAANITIGGGVSMPNDSIVVSAENPNLQTQGLWIQTFDNGDFTFWIEDGE